MKGKITWLLLDVPYLCWRAYHTTGQLEYRDVLTGVIYGVLRDIVNLQKLHNTEHVVFCFDHGTSFRVVNYAGYKSSRRDAVRTEEQQLAYAEVRRQIALLKKQYLKEVGFKNIFYRKGYEADDILASIVFNTLRKTDDAIIVSADHDLFQLLQPNVMIWNPNKKRMYQRHQFIADWGVEPEAWVDVKAIAGCSSDDIPGIHGVGEKTACGFLSGRIQSGTKFNAIVSGQSIWKRNRHLVKLPYPGTPCYALAEDKVTDKKWQALTAKLGMRSLVDYTPTTPQRKGFGL